MQVGTSAPSRLDGFKDLAVLLRPAPVGAVGLVGPAWTRGEIEKPAGKKDMGGWQALVPHLDLACTISYSSHVSRCIPLSSNRG